MRKPIRQSGTSTAVSTIDGGRRKVIRQCIAAVGSIALSGRGTAAEPPLPARPPAPIPSLARLPTLGGTQFWSDTLIRPPWRIQRHVLTDVCRLLDGDDRAVSWGSYKKCLQQFAELERQRQVPPLKPRVVIVLHGAIRTRRSMARLCRFLESRAGYTAINVSYASTRAEISRHARTLAQIIGHLGPQVKEINFVAHSMGNLIIRHFLQDQKRLSRPPAGYPKIRRIVMLAPPNQGTQLAQRVQDNLVFRALWGVSGGEMATWNALAPRLAIPACEFGIIAGDFLAPQEGNPLIEGPDDLVLAVSETRLPGAHDFLELPVSHSTIMHDERVQTATLRFLTRGHFRDSRARKPIPSTPPPSKNLTPKAGS